MSLCQHPARSLTSREIAKTVSGLLGGLATFCHPDDIAIAIEHFHKHGAFYRGVWLQTYLSAHPTVEDRTP